MDRVGIERLCVFGAMPPAAFVELAAELGCRFVGVGLAAMRYYDPDGCPDWSLQADPALRRETLAALRDRGVSLSLVEGFAVRPDADVREQAAGLDVVAELGGTRISIASADRDRSRTLDQFALVAEMAAARGIETVIEIGPQPVRDLPAALEAVRHVGRPNFKLLVDAMHFFRFGGRAADLAAVDPALIGYLQLCDAPRISRHASYMDEALHERMVPGEGELPLLELLAVAPREVVVSVEVPQRSLAEAGVGPRERVGRCVAAARRLLAEARSASQA